MKYLLTILSVFISIQTVWAQKKVAITLDDVPNTSQYHKDHYKPIFLNRLDSLTIPIAIFINENKIYHGDSITGNFALLQEWISKPYMTLGNHSFSHQRYSTTGFELYQEEVQKGEAITRELGKKYDKPLKYFRFPFNDMGKDSIQHLEIRNFLHNEGYIIAPFTVESSDWMYRAVYDHYIEGGEYAKAKEIGNQYVAKTLEYFTFFEALNEKIYGRQIHQIYLCHDNQLNADFLPTLVDSLAARGYEFISLEEAMKDEAYQQTDHYFKKWGVSWYYRWMPEHEARLKWMRKEPSTAEIQKLFEEIQKSRE